MKRSNNVKPSAKAIKAVEILASKPGIAISAAMREAGYSEKTALSPKDNFLELKSVQQIAAKMQVSLENRIGIDKIVNKIDEQLEANKWYLSQTGPDFQDADYSARAKGIDLALKALSFGQPTNTGGQTNVQINVNASKYVKD